MPDTINTRRYSNFLKRLLNMKAVNPAQELGPDVLATLPVDVPDAAENQAIRGIRPWGFTTYCHADSVGATTNVCFLANYPADSNLLVVLKEVRISGTIPDTTGLTGDGAICFIARVNPTVGFLAAPCIELDPRMASIASYINNVTSPAHALPQTVLANCTHARLISPSVAAEPFDVLFENVDIVLSPNSYVEFGLFLQTATTASWPYIISAKGYERMRQDPEAGAQAL